MEKKINTNTAVTLPKIRTVKEALAEIKKSEQSAKRD